MKYFIDTEFVETVGHIELISIGIVAEDGREYYAVHTEADLKDAYNWVKENVLAPMPEYMPAYNDLRGYKLKEEEQKPGTQGHKRIVDIKHELLFWLGTKNNVPEKCEFYGYFADYDWVVFCWIFGRMIHLPNGFLMWCRDIKQIMDRMGISREDIDRYVDRPDTEHNALSDARWNKRAFEYLSSHKMSF